MNGRSLGCGVNGCCGGFVGFHIVQQRCSAPASETVEGERERIEGGKMQDAGCRTEAARPSKICAEKIRQLVFPTALAASSLWMMEEACRCLVGGDVPEQGRKLL